MKVKVGYSSECKKVWRYLPWHSNNNSPPFPAKLQLLQSYSNIILKFFSLSSSSISVYVKDELDFKFLSNMVNSKYRPIKKTTRNIVNIYQHPQPKVWWQGWCYVAHRAKPRIFLHISKSWLDYDQGCCWWILWLPRQRKIDMMFWNQKALGHFHTANCEARRIILWYLYLWSDSDNEFVI